MNTILLAAVIIGATGLIIALLLGVAANVFAVPVDEKAVAIREVLPGANCGGCGYAGCDALAEAIAKGEAPVNGCPVGGAEKAAQIGDIMGVSAGDAVKMVAYVKCAGTCEKAGIKANYYGISDCKRAAAIPGKGDKACAFGCMGLGSSGSISHSCQVCSVIPASSLPVCLFASVISSLSVCLFAPVISSVSACQFDAIHVKGGIAVVDKDNCVACGKCIEECPNGLIELVPYDAKWAVACSNKDKGPAVMKVCDTGCIGCGLCAKSCNFDAITVENNVAHIDQSKCKGCGLCAQKCPKKVIVAH